jgi:hypothetical protein
MREHARHGERRPRACASFFDVHDLAQLQQVWRTSLHMDGVHRRSDERIRPRWHSLRKDRRGAPHGVGEPRGQVSTQRERDGPRRDGADLIEAGQFFGGALEVTKGRWLQVLGGLNGAVRLCQK